MRYLRHPMLPGALLALTGLVHPWLEATMARHMLLELPLLFGAGWLAAESAAAPRWRWTHSYAPALLLAALLASSVWMLPVALDQAVLHPASNAAKVLGMCAAGAAAGAAWPRSGTILQGFFVLNWAWMTITAGLLYQEAKQQLCSIYLSDQQSMAGTGLVTLGAGVLALWLAHAMILPALAGQRPAAIDPPF